MSEATKPQGVIDAEFAVSQAIEKPKRLAMKILEIQDAVGVVNKKGKFGSEMGGGNYLRIEDAVVAVNKLLTAHKLIFTGTLLPVQLADGYPGFHLKHSPHEKGGKDSLTRSGYITSLIMEWTLEDTETLEKRSWNFPGDGYDGTDKAVYKAMTGSRKYAIINIFNLPIGNDVEEHGAPTFDESKKAARKVAETKLAEKANSDNPKIRKLAVDALSQIEPEKKIIIARPENFNGHYIAVSGLIAVPQLEQYFMDVDAKRLQSKVDKGVYWRVPSDYERGLIDLCGKLGIEVEG
jgi:ERF superfamily